MFPDIAGLLRMHADTMRTAAQQAHIAERFTAAQPQVRQATVPALPMTFTTWPVCAGSANCSPADLSAPPPSAAKDRTSTRGASPHRRRADGAPAAGILTPGVQSLARDPPQRHKSLDRQPDQFRAEAGALADLGQRGGTGVELGQHRADCAAPTHQRIRRIWNVATANNQATVS